ncbi:hypothetical protein T484DRAFT_1753558 [Baffinella frigidus]|nr:hypothetical protein T484DRAFT_1753558 [Cryptophyta sp. CCMP2293]
MPESEPQARAWVPESGDIGKLEEILQRIPGLVQQGKVGHEVGRTLHKAVVKAIQRSGFSSAERSVDAVEEGWGTATAVGAVNSPGWGIALPDAAAPDVAAANSQVPPSGDRARERDVRDRGGEKERAAGGPPGREGREPPPGSARSRPAGTASSLAPPGAQSHAATVATVGSQPGSPKDEKEEEGDEVRDGKAWSCASDDREEREGGVGQKRCPTPDTRHPAPATCHPLPSILPCP